MRPRTSRYLRWLVLVNLAASALHFGDNMLHFAEYPEPSWISNPLIVDSLWLVITPLLLVGWRFASRGRARESVVMLWAYGALSLFVLGHYSYASPSELPLRINALIGLEAFAAVLLVLLAPALQAARYSGTSANL